jgi:hypothetical protein
MNDFKLNLYNDDNTFKIRSVYLDDKGWIFAVYDFINLACGRDEKSDYGKTCFHNLMSESTEIQHEFFFFQFSRELQRKTPVTNFRGLQKILLLLPGETGNKYRDLCEITITRVLAGDQSLHDIIDENYKSNEFINETARDSLNRNSPNFKEINSLLLRKIDKLKIKVSDLQIENIELKNNIKNKEKMLELKDNNINIMINNISSLSVNLNKSVELANNLNNDNRNLKNIYKYEIPCQSRNNNIIKQDFNNNYNLKNSHVLQQIQDPNPGTLLNRNKKRRFYR